MSAGNVYVFNATPKAMDLYLNNHELARGVAGVKQSASYQPTANQAARSPASKSEVAQFGSENELVVSFPIGGSQRYTVNIDPNQTPLEDDLQLYVFFNQVVLVSPTGAGHSIVLVGTAILADELDRLEQRAGVA
jgi:hypothetical protein